MTDDEIKAARALCEAASPGPWSHEHEAYPWISGQDDDYLGGPTTIVEWNETGETAHADAAFIAAARTLLPAALDALEQARRERDEARAHVLAVVANAVEAAERDVAAQIAALKELAIAESQAVAPPEPVAEVTWDRGEGCITARIGPLEIEILGMDSGYTWSVLAFGERTIARHNRSEEPMALPAAKAAAIAAARAWRDSIRL